MSELAGVRKIPTFRVERPDDETLKLSIGQREIATLNHDEHGWQGMKTAEDLFRKIAHRLHATVTG